MYHSTLHVDILVNHDRQLKVNMCPPIPHTVAIPNVWGVRFGVDVKYVPSGPEEDAQTWSVRTCTLQCLTCSGVSASVVVATASASAVAGVLAMCSLVVLGAGDVGGYTSGPRVASVAGAVAPVVVLTTASGVGVTSVGAIATA